MTLKELQESEKKILLRENQLRDCKSEVAA